MEADDPYCYPGTDVLKNLAGCTDRSSLEASETNGVVLNLGILRESPITGSYTLHRLKETHRRIFDGIYSWAGQFREHTGRMTKHRGGYPIIYADSAYIEHELQKVFTGLAKEKSLLGLDIDQFARRAAYYYTEIDAIHPFRDGNSRTLRQFMTDLALHAGYQLDWSRVASDEESRQRLFLARDVGVMCGDSTRLAAIIGAALSPVQNLGNTLGNASRQPSATEISEFLAVERRPRGRRH